MTSFTTNATERWMAIDPEALYAPVRGAFPRAPARVLDVGAGAGREAIWLLGQGHDVTCAEPDAVLRGHGQTVAQAACWRHTALPELAGIAGPFELILVSAVWHLLADAARPAALLRLAEVLGPRGVVIVSLKQAPGAPCLLDEGAVTAAGLGIAASENAPSVQAGNRALGVSWQWVVLRKAPTERMVNAALISGA